MTRKMINWWFALSFRVPENGGAELSYLHGYSAESVQNKGNYQARNYYFAVEKQHVDLHDKFEFDTIISNINMRQWGGNINNTVRNTL